MAHERPRTDGDALLRAILDDPEDATAALAYADWLDETGGPAEQDRAAFIRIQQRLPEMKHDDPQRGPLYLQQQSLLAKYRAQWLAGVPPALHKHVEFVGGFPRRVKLAAPQLVTHEAILCRPHPVSEVTITGTLSRKAAAALAGMQWWRRVRLLRLQSSAKDARSLEALLRSPYLRGVRELEADNCALGTGGGAAVLAAWPGLASVMRLRLIGNALGAAHIDLLCRSPHLLAPADLLLSDNELDDEAARIMAGCAKLSGLRVLWLYRNQIGPEGAKALAASPHLAGLERLSLMVNPIGDEGALALTASFPKLEMLMLAASGLAEETKARLRERFPCAIL